MIPAHVARWTTRQWLAVVVALLLVIIVMLLVIIARPRAAADRAVVRIVDGATPISTVVVPLR
ncbi:MAG TPA: hypothetical protein VGJ60_26315 [Chloroflexota bacterium]|jgi:hypothetical protein